MAFVRNPVVYVPDLTNGRPIVDGKVYLLTAGTVPPTQDSAINPATLLTVTYVNEAGNTVTQPQPLYTSKGGCLYGSFPEEAAQYSVSNNSFVFAAYDKRGRLQYSAETAGSDSVEVDDLAAEESTVLIAGVQARQLRVVDGIKNLIAQPNASMYVNGFYAGGNVGGGYFYYDPLISKSLHDGGLFISPEAISAWNGSQSSISTLLDWSGYGLGCFVRSISQDGVIAHVTPEMFGATRDGLSDDSASIQAATSCQEPLHFCAGTYMTSKPIAVPSNKHITIPSGAKVKASESFASITSPDGASMFWSPSVPGGAQDILITGTGTVDGSGIADRGFYGRFMIRGIVEKLNIIDVNLHAVHIGAQGLSKSFEVTVKDIEAKSAAPNHVDGIGIFFDNASDCYIENCVPIGFRVGIRCLATSTKIVNGHPWTAPSYGPMVRGISIGAPGCVLFGCYADTPTNLGDPLIPEVYGFYIETNAGEVSLFGCSGFLADKIGGVDVGFDNVAVGIYAQSSGARILNIGGTWTSGNAAKRWKELYGSSNLTLLLKNIRNFGISNDGRFVAYSGGDRFVGSIVTNMNRQVSSDRGDSSVTLAADSAPVQYFNTPLTAARTISLPTTELYSGLEFRITRTSAASGASNLIVSFNGSTLKTLSAGQWADFGVDNSLNFKLIASGTV